MDWKSAREQLTGRCAQSRKVANNTYLERLVGPNTVEDNSIGLRLHDTHVIVWYEDGSIVLNSGGWRTVTTKARINEYLGNGYGISQEKGQWYIVKHGDWTKLCIFEDGITFSPEGEITGGKPVGEEKKALKLRKTVNRYADKFAHAFDSGKVSKPGAGDCFYCQMREVKTGKPLGECSHDNGHILAHLEENYFVPSLLNRAIEVSNTSIAFKATVGAVWANDPEHRFFKVGDKWFLNDLKKTISKYLLKQLGQAA